MRSFWIIWVDLKSNNKSPYKRHTEENSEEKEVIQREGQRLEGGGHKPWSQRMLTATGSWRRQRMYLPLGASRESVAVRHLGFDVWPQNCERSHFCYFKPQCLWSSVMAAPGNAYTPPDQVLNMCSYSGSQALRECQQPSLRNSSHASTTGALFPATGTPLFLSAPWQYLCQLSAARSLWCQLPACLSLCGTCPSYLSSLILWSLVPWPLGSDRLCSH